jgi:dihydrofolate synthase/folylpolyglutamate synthase
LLRRLFALETSGIKLGLDNISRLCAALGHPERTFTTLHVAGTNGKGSVTAMAHAALVSAGVRAGRYISPHLVDLTERFVIGSKPVDAEALERAAGDVLDCADRLKSSGDLGAHPTFFEATTAIAFELFRRARVEVAVIEVGLGGRYDSTNIIAPAAGAITSIGFDHQQWLGESIEAIAYEKAGIIKSGMDVVIGALPDEARRVVYDVAAGRQARIIDAALGTRVTGDVGGRRDELIIETPEDRYGPLSLALGGEHQIGNALVAIRLLEAARPSGVRVPRNAIERGLTEVDWPGRLELIRLQDGGQVLLDAAHNVDGARALSTYLLSRHPERPALVIGVMRDKDVEGIIGALLPAVSAVIATSVGGIPDLIQDGVTGLLVPPGDAEALARARAALLLDPKKAEGFGRAARERWEQEYGLDKFYTATQRVYDDATAHLPS